MNSIELIDELLSHGCWLESRDECGETALHWAVRESLLDIVDYLLAHGANPDALNDDDESSAHFAEVGRRINIIMGHYWAIGPFRFVPDLFLIDLNSARKDFLPFKDPLHE